MRSLLRQGQTASVFFCLILAVALGAVTAFAGDRERSRVQGPFETTGADPDASATLKLNFRSSKSRVDVKIRDLSPSTAYELRVGGIPEASFTSDSNGRAKLRFERPLKSGKAQTLVFDPRGQMVTLHDGTMVVLSLVASGPGEPDGIKVDERTLLAPQDPNCAGAEADARFKLKKDGRRTFKVKFEGVPPGDYALIVDGIERGNINVPTGKDKGKFDFRSPESPPRPLLDYDPRGLEIAIMRGTAVCFSGPLEAKVEGVSECDPSADVVCLLATGAAGDGDARAELETQDDCDLEFEVEVDDVSEGDYALCVAGVFRGTIPVVADPNDAADTEGEIEFEKPPEEGELPLDFEVDFSQIEIREAGDPNAQDGDACPSTTLLFAGVDPNGDDCLPGPGEDSCDPEGEEITLLNLGDPNTPDATGEARCEVEDDCDQKFRVKIEDLPAGDYDLVVDSVQSVITVSNDPNDDSGEIRFATHPDEPEESPFPEGFPDSCSGLDLTIRSGGTDILSGSFP